MADAPVDLSSIFDLDLDQLTIPRSLFQVELDLFRLTEMARVWLEENRIAPYKLALLAGVSTSQTHRTLHDDWRPSHRLLERLARALPEEWVADFERDCDQVLPGAIHHLPDSRMLDRLTDARSKAATSDSPEAFQSYLKHNGYSFTTMDRRDGRLRFRTLHTADPRLTKMASDRGYITPFFRPLIRQYQGPELINLAILRHPLILGDHCVTSTYWQLQLQAFGMGYCITDRIAVVPVASARQARLVRRFYDILIPSLIGKDTD